jgi:hypothetical protein
METKVIVNNFLKGWIFFMIFFSCEVSRGQTIDWSTTNNWRIYALNNKEAYFYSADTLANFKSVVMNDSIVISYLTHAKAWPVSKSGTWMGIYIASYETVAKVRQKIVLSSYGGFLFDSWSRRYYELPRELREGWNDYIMKNLKSAFEE